MNIQEFKKLPLIGILRDISPEVVKPLTEAIVSSGLKTIEIAMNNPLAAKLIKKVVKLASTHLTIGAGTVLTSGDLNKARDAGATFIVLPTLVPEVVELCVKNKIPVFPGAFSPQEIYNAWRSGATMVKVFPVKFFGPSYIKEIKGPFSEIELLACGGVNPDNIKDFFSCGAQAVAFGSSIFRKGWIKKGQFFRIEESIKTLIAKFSV